VFFKLDGRVDIGISCLGAQFAGAVGEDGGAVGFGDEDEDGEG
jgi:hypothetical protein